TLLHAPAVRHLIVLAVLDQAGARSDHSDDQIAINRQTIFPAGKKTKLPRKPIGEASRGRFDTLAEPALTGTAPRKHAANSRTAGNTGGDPLVERGCDRCHFSVARVTKDGNSLLIDLVECFQIVDHGLCGPGAAR